MAGSESRPPLVTDEENYWHAECAPPVSWAQYMRMWQVHPESDVPEDEKCVSCGKSVHEEP